MEQFLVTTNMKVLPHLFHKKYNCWYFYFLVCFWQSFLHHHHINIKQFWKSNRESLQKYWKIHEMVRSDPDDQILTILQEIYNEENLEVKRDPLIIILGKTGWTAEANFLGGPGRSPLPAGICASRILWGPNHPPPHPRLLPSLNLFHLTWWNETVNDLLLFIFHGFAFIPTYIACCSLRTGSESLFLCIPSN